jgi:hypothetical protein
MLQIIIIKATYQQQKHFSIVPTRHKLIASKKIFQFWTCAGLVIIITSWTGQNHIFSSTFKKRAITWHFSEWYFARQFPLKTQIIYNYFIGNLAIKMI